MARSAKVRYEFAKAGRSRRLAFITFFGLSMFTGIVETTATVAAIQRDASGIQLRIQTPELSDSVVVGESVAVNGACLTATRIEEREAAWSIQFDLLEETWNRTNLRYLQPGNVVNIERALKANARLSGHFVTGHIDEVGRIRTWRPEGADYLLEIDTPESLWPYFVSKGCVAIDGISLTIADTLPTGVRIWIIPHTRAVTCLRDRVAGDHVNVETDMLAKYVQRLVASQG